MKIKKPEPVIRFTYSYPYEEAMLTLVGEKLTQEHSETTMKKVKAAQAIWNAYERQILRLFEEMYKIEISEKCITTFISLVAPNSFSRPLTISLKHSMDIVKNEKSQRAFIYTVIHELAHYFSYTRGDTEFFNVLYDKVQKLDLLGEHGANLHYLIQAVEFGIIGEVFGPRYANYSRDWTIDNWSDNEYGKSALLLKEHDVPLDKTCLEYIEKRLKE